MRTGRFGKLGTGLGGAAVVLLFLAVSPADAQRRKPPYYASIARDEARMRTGPGKNYPSSWLYRRLDLPIRVIGIYNDWRKVEDPDGTQGWMFVGLLSDARTALIVGSTTELRDAPRLAAHINWRAEAGVVGRISRCSRGWCYFDVRGRGGYVEQSKLWGVDPGEEI